MARLSWWWLGALIPYVAGCSSGAGEEIREAGDGGFPQGSTRTPEQAWPWLAGYQSPGCQAAATCTAFVDERDGREYRAVRIGEQTWMGSSLDYGDTPALKGCPLDEPAWCAAVGGLYHWHDAMQLPESCDLEDCSSQIGNPHQGLCPPGWHVPTLDELSRLLDTVGETVGDSCDTGRALKTTQGWVNGADYSGADSFGFALLPQHLYAAGGTVWVGRTWLWTTASPATFLEVELHDCAKLNSLEGVGRGAGLRCVADPG